MSRGKKEESPQEQEPGIPTAETRKRTYKKREQEFDEGFDNEDGEEYGGLGFEEEDSPIYVKAMRSSYFLIVLILGLTIAIAWGAVNFTGTPKNRYEADITRLELDLVNMREADTTVQSSAASALSTANSNAGKVETLTQKITTIESSYVSHGTLESYAKTADLDNYAKSSDLSNYLRKGSLDGFANSSELTSMRNGLRSEIDGVENESQDRDAVLSGDIENVKVSVNNLASIVAARSNLEYTFERENSDSNLVILSNVDAVYRARISLVYDEPVVLSGNSTELASRDFFDNLVSPNRNYMPEIIWNGVDWILVETHFYTGELTLEAGIEEEFAIAVKGLENFDEYEAYIEFVSKSENVDIVDDGGI